MKWISLLLAAFFSAAIPLHSQTPATMPALRAEFSRIAGYPAGAVRNDSLTAFLNRLQAAQQIPFTTNDSVTFVVRASSGNVQIFGDHTAWGTSSGVPFNAAKHPLLDIYTLTIGLPSDAKSDYKVVLGNNWILDPLNQRQQWGGFGPNSTFWMPQYRVTTEMNPRQGVPKGSLSNPIRVTSSRLGYTLQYRVYTPPGYAALSNLPVVYFTDGHEYADQNLGAVPTIIDNGIADGLFPPLMAVFIDPRNPDNLSQNRRQQELVRNASYSDFIALDLIPTIDAAFKTDPKPEKRAIAGTSLGGFHAAWFAARHPDKVGNVLIHSPALWVDVSIIETWRNGKFPVKTFLSYGTLFDGTENARSFRNMLESSAYRYQSIERSEGHSWGQWRTLIDEPLQFFFGENATQNRIERPAKFEIELQAHPNPFNPATTVTISSRVAGTAYWKILDVSGRTILQRTPVSITPGKQHIVLNMTGKASGVYLFVIESPDWGILTQKLTLLQ